MYKVQYNCVLYGECTLILHLVYVLHWPGDGCETAITRPVQNIYKMQYKCTLSIEYTVILYLVHVLHWPDDSCFTAETRSPDVTDMSSL